MRNATRLNLMPLLKVLMAGVIMLMFMSSSAYARACNGNGSPCFGDGPRFKPGTCRAAPSSVGVCIENADKDMTCTNNAAYNPKTVAPGAGIISIIIRDIKRTLRPMTVRMFNGISNDNGFKRAATAALTLYVIFYAVTFMFGMVQLTVFDFFVRMVKISIVAMLVKGTAFAVFSDTFIKFFNDGTDSIITKVSTIAVSGTTLGGQPFDWMDNAILELTSVKMLVTLMAAFGTGVYGFVIIFLLMIALYTFVKAMLNALWVYLLSLVLRTLLFGLAPLFLACVMFSKTRPLFDGWLNQVVNSCLQPIFLFTFFSFFVQLIKSALEQVLQTNVCWTQVNGFDGTASANYMWRFALWKCDAGRWEPFDGIWGFTGAENVDANSVTNKSDCGKGRPIHPLGIMLPLTIWILADLAKRFNDIVINIAKDIAHAGTTFNYPLKTIGGDRVSGGSGPSGGGGGPGGGGRPGAGGAPSSSASSLLKDAMSQLSGGRAGPPGSGAPASSPAGGGGESGGGGQSRGRPPTTTL